jgi:SAM-dependent methyltransferase
MDRTASDRASHEQVNVEYWVADEVVDDYAGRSLRQVEAAILDRYSDAFQGRVLEVGCGAGRVTAHLVKLATNVHGIDISASMVDHCRRAFPQGDFRVADLRELGEYHDGFFDTVFASFNVIDCVSPEDRGIALETWRRVLTPDGLLVMSSHNRDYLWNVRTPGRQVLSSLRSGNPRRIGGSIRRLPLWLRNHRRLQHLERRDDNAAVAADASADYGILYSYISRDEQARQLAAHGFDLIECLDRQGAPVEPGAEARESNELHYIARPV